MVLLLRWVLAPLLLRLESLRLRLLLIVLWGLLLLFLLHLLLVPSLQ